jgi:uncharacterized protein DUF3558
MRSVTVVLASAGCAALLAGCSSSGGGSSNAGATGTTSTTSTSSSTSSTPSSASGSGVAATHLDPCKLVTRAEASKLAGVTLRAGQEQSSNGAKVCSYAGSSTSVVTVEVVQGQTAAEAKAQWDTEQAKAQDAVKKSVPAGLDLHLDTTNLTGLGDRAAAVRASAKISGQAFGITGIYVLKGSTFFAFQNLAFGRSAASENALKSEARTVLGRL